MYSIKTSGVWHHAYNIGMHINASHQGQNMHINILKWLLLLYKWKREFSDTSLKLEKHCQCHYWGFVSTVIIREKYTSVYCPLLISIVYGSIVHPFNKESPERKTWLSAMAVHSVVSNWWTFNWERHLAASIRSLSRIFPHQHHSCPNIAIWSKTILEQQVKITRRTFESGRVYVRSTHYMY